MSERDMGQEILDGIQENQSLQRRKPEVFLEIA